jgi:hypothetical protein
VQDSISLVLGGGSMLEVRTLSPEKKKELKKASQHTAQDQSSWQQMQRQLGASHTGLNAIAVDERTHGSAAVGARAVDCGTSTAQRPVLDVGSLSGVPSTSTPRAENHTTTTTTTTTTSSSRSSSNSQATQQQTCEAGAHRTVLGVAKVGS